MVDVVISMDDMKNLITEHVLRAQSNVLHPCAKHVSWNLQWVIMDNKVEIRASVAKIEPKDAAE